MAKSAHVGCSGLGIAFARSPCTRKSPQWVHPAGPSPGPQERPAGAAWGLWAEQEAHLGLSPHRDAQRVEELCAKNQQLREQQKALKENVRALENR